MPQGLQDHCVTVIREHLKDGWGTETTRVGRELRIRISGDDWNLQIAVCEDRCGPARLTFDPIGFPEKSGATSPIRRSADALVSASGRLVELGYEGSWSLATDGTFSGMFRKDLMTIEVIQRDMRALQELNLGY